ncbi:MAG: hypothetical protein Q4C46_10195 [Bacillota bacterium]|nr:hypothetical protein [Bacillota bacterium]
MKRKKKDIIMDTIPTSPKVKIDKRERELFFKRVNKVLAEVETDVGSAHLFEPLSDVIRRKHMNSDIRAEICDAIFAEYLIIREHCSRRDALLGQVEILEEGEQKHIDKCGDEKKIDEVFFRETKEMLKELYKEVQL